MELIYLYHSGFALLGEGFTVIMDYFEDSVSATSGVVHDELLKRPGKLYVLSSHSHADHSIKTCSRFGQNMPTFHSFSRGIFYSRSWRGRKMRYGWRKENITPMNFCRYMLSDRPISACLFLSKWQGKRYFMQAT